MLPKLEPNSGRASTGSPGVWTTEQGAAGGQAWPVTDPSLAEVDALLRHHRPVVAPADPKFVRALGAHLIGTADLAQHRARGRDAVGAARPPVARLGRSMLGTLAPWLAALAARAPRRLAGTAFAAVALASIALLTVSRAVPSAPPAIDRDALVAKNAAAWTKLQGLTGAFTTGDGWYYEEWISRQPGGQLRFKRFIRPPARSPNKPQWNVSDGRTEWVIDAATKAVRFSRAAVPGDFTMVAPNDAMQCTALALPATIGDGPDPWPVLVGDRPAYRLDGRFHDGSAAVYWLDASDHLVFRIDRPIIGTVWERVTLAIDPRLPERLFSPESLTNL